MAAGRKTGGRQKGTPNRTTASIKAAFVEAFEKLGGVDALVAWGNENPTDFYKLAARLIPTEVKADIEGGLQVIVQRFADDGEACSEPEGQA